MNRGLERVDTCLEWLNTRVWAGGCKFQTGGQKTGTGKQRLEMTGQRDGTALRQTYRSLGQIGEDE